MVYYPFVERLDIWDDKKVYDAHCIERQAHINLHSVWQFVVFFLSTAKLGHIVVK